MSNILLPIESLTLPQDFCFTSWQNTLDQFANHMRAVLANGRSFYNFGDTVPTPDKQVYPWLKTVGGVPERWYVYSSGRWIWPYTVPAGGIRWNWAGTETDLKTFDGGEDATVSIFTGPFWEIDHDFDGRSPMGPGAIPDSTPAAILNIGNNFGEGSHKLTAAELPDLSTALEVGILIPGHGGEDGARDACDGGTLSNPLTNSPALFPGYGQDSQGFPQVKMRQNAGGQTDQPHQTVHPVRGLYIIKRTIRAFYRGN